MARTYLANQLFTGKLWNGFTPKSHLFNAFDLNDTAIMKKVTQLYEMNGYMDFVDMVMSHGVEYISPEKDFVEWYLDPIGGLFHHHSR